MSPQSSSSSLEKVSVKYNVGQILINFVSNSGMVKSVLEMNDTYFSLIDELNRFCEEDIQIHNTIISEIKLPPIYVPMIQPSAIKVMSGFPFTNLSTSKQNVHSLTMERAVEIKYSFQELNETKYAPYLRVGRDYQFQPIIDNLQPKLFESVFDRIAYFDPSKWDGSISSLSIYADRRLLSGNFDILDQFIPYFVTDKVFGSIMDVKAKPLGDGALPIRHYLQSQDFVAIKGGKTNPTHNE